MIIVSGKIYVCPGAGHEFLASSLEAVVQARRSPGAATSSSRSRPTPLEPDRVNVSEEWESEEALLTFRGDGPGEDLSSKIVRADVARHVVASSGPP
jgi:quinol monooxygenase YgiN